MLADLQGSRVAVDQNAVRPLQALIYLARLAADPDGDPLICPRAVGIAPTM